jgi:thiol reductant ABC exporter CydC subunit
VRTGRRLFMLMRGQRRWLFVGAVLSFVAVATNVALMALSAFLISRAAVVSNVAEVALAITGVRVLAIGRATFRYLERYVTHRSTFAILTELRVWFFASIEPLAPARLSGRRSGDLLSRIVADIETLEDFYVRIVIPPIVAVLVTVCGGLLLGAFDPLLGVTLTLFIVVSGVVLPVTARRLSMAPAATEIAVRGELSATVVDAVQGLADLIVLDRAAAHRARVLALGMEMDVAIERQARVRSLTDALAAAVASLAGVAVLAIGVVLVGAGRLDGVFLALLPLAAVACFEIIGPLSQAFALWGANTAAADRLFDLIETPPDPESAVQPEGRAIVPVDTSIDIRGLRFRYSPGDPWALDGVDLTIPSGTSLAIIGPSGSGKSTIVNLLLRFWTANDGETRLGGHDIRDYPVDQVRAMLGVVAQDVHLFNGTIRDNLAVADPDVTDAQIEAACRLAQVHDFVETLPLGYQTNVGENGLLLSGGERQRIAIARAVIKDAPILILDEATANLDVETERRLMASLRSFIAGRTTITISHRASVAEGMDRTVRLVDGRLRDAPSSRRPGQPPRRTIRR